MKKLAVLLMLALAVSCAQQPPKTSDLGRKAFEDWAKAAASGDAEKTLAGCSVGNLSEWLYRRLEENDDLTRRWRGSLTGRPRTDLDLWWGVSRNHGSGRTELLSESVLQHPSFRQLFRDYYTLTFRDIQTQFSKVEISQSYGDDTGVTIVAKLGGGGALYVGMVYERDGWKIDIVK